MRRTDDFETRREHLRSMSDEELKAYFWKLAQQVVDPLLEYGRTHTSPSVERSVLLRMGFSSLEAKPMVDHAITNNLIGHGVGNIVYRVAKSENLSIRDAGVKLSQGQLWDKAAQLFEGGAK
jgi:D-ornithine 4,5-aminomutase subunit alpha